MSKTDDFDLFANPLPAITPPNAPTTGIVLRCHDCLQPSVTPLCARCELVHIGTSLDQ